MLKHANDPLRSPREICVPVTHASPCEPHELTPTPKQQLFTLVLGTYNQRNPYQKLAYFYAQIIPSHCKQLGKFNNPSSSPRASVVWKIPGILQSLSNASKKKKKRNRVWYMIDCARGSLTARGWTLQFPLCTQETPRHRSS